MPKFARLPALALAAICLNGCYLSHVVGGQIGVMTSTISVDEALRRGDLSAADKDKLRYIQRVKRYGEDVIGLKPTCNFSTYLPGEKKPITYTVVGAKRDALDVVTWWYPIVGTAAYKGFFDRKMAMEERDELRRNGFDAAVWPAGAYSTLGWFCDPILPTMLDEDEGELAALILHELTHPTLYVSGATEFDESLADFVAHTAAPKFLDETFGPGNVHSARLAADYRLGTALDGAIRRLADRLTPLYAAHPPDVLARRETEFAATRREMEDICARAGAHGAYCKPDAELDNAVVISRLTYGSPAEFEKLFAAVRGDWRRFFATLIAKYDPPPAWYEDTETHRTAPF